MRLNCNNSGPCHLVKNHEFIIIVGKKEQAAEHLWLTLCQANQWTRLTETIVTNILLAANGQSVREQVPSMVDVADNFPYRVCDQWVPSSNSRFIYLIGCCI